MRALAVAVFVLLCLRLCPAQDPAPLLDREQKLAARAVQGLHAAADALAAQKQHARALALRREVWMEYAENDARARELSGFVRVGDLWRKDGERLPLDKDLKGAAGPLKKLDAEWKALAKEL